MLLVGLTTTVSPVAARLISTPINQLDQLVSTDHYPPASQLQLRPHLITRPHIGDARAFQPADGFVGLNRIDGDLAQECAAIAVDDIEFHAAGDAGGAADVDGG